MKHAAERGVTSVQDLPGNSLDVAAWEKLRRRGELTVRVTQWDETHPFPDRASYLTGYSAVLIDRYTLMPRFALSTAPVALALLWGGFVAARWWSQWRNRKVALPAI